MNTFLTVLIMLQELQISLKDPYHRTCPQTRLTSAISALTKIVLSL